MQDSEKNDVTYHLTNTGLLELNLREFIMLRKICLSNGVVRHANYHEWLGHYYAISSMAVEHCKLCFYQQNISPGGLECVHQEKVTQQPPRDVFPFIYSILLRSLETSNLKLNPFL